MNNIFWYQPEKLSEEDVIIVNGKRLNNGTERTIAFDKLKKIADKAIGKQRPWHGYVDKYYFIKGSLDRTDERGRPLSFMFISDEINGYKYLTDALNTAQIGLARDTAELIETSKPSSKKSYNTALWIIFILCISLIIILICSKYGK